MSQLNQDAEVYGLKPETVPNSEKVEILNIHKINIELQFFFIKNFIIKSQYNYSSFFESPS